MLKQSSMAVAILLAATAVDNPHQRDRALRSTSQIRKFSA
jgi:hypothetical protein